MKKNIKNAPVSLTPAQRTNNRITKALKRLMREHREDTTITLDEFEDLLPNVEQDYLIDFLNGTKQGEVIEGRRGHPTRFVFGEAEDSSWSKWIRAMDYRRQWRKDNGRDPATGRLLRKPRGQKPATARKTGFRKVVLRVPAGVEVVSSN